jgi:hypothetical protein
MSAPADRHEQARLDAAEQRMAEKYPDLPALPPLRRAVAEIYNTAAVYTPVDIPRPLPENPVERYEHCLAHLEAQGLIASGQWVQLTTGGGLDTGALFEEHARLNRRRKRQTVGWGPESRATERHGLTFTWATPEPGKRIQGHNFLRKLQPVVALTYGTTYPATLVFTEGALWAALHPDHSVNVLVDGEFPEYTHFEGEPIEYVEDGNLLEELPAPLPADWLEMGFSSACGLLLSEGWARWLISGTVPHWPGLTKAAAHGASTDDYLSCRRCLRPLTTVDSRRLGIGPECWPHVQHQIRRWYRQEVVLGEDGNYSLVPLPTEPQP